MLAYLHTHTAGLIHVSLPPSHSCPGVHEACCAPQLTEQPWQPPLGVETGAEQALFCCCPGQKGKIGTTGTPAGDGGLLFLTELAYASAP